MLAELAQQVKLLAQGSNMEDWGDLLIVAIMAVHWLGGALAKVITSNRKGPQQRQPGQRKPSMPQQGARTRETWQQRLARKAEEMQRAVEAKGRQLQQDAKARAEAQRQRPARGPRQTPAPPAGHVTIRPGRKGDSVLVYERPTTKPATQRQHQVKRQRQIRNAALTGGQQTVAPPPVEARIEIARPGSEPIVEGMAALMREPPAPLDTTSTPSRPPRDSGGFAPAALIDYSDPDALRKAILHYEILGKPLAFRDPSEQMGAF